MSTFFSPELPNVLVEGTTQIAAGNNPNGGYITADQLAAHAAANHDHDTDYAALSHDHDADYAALSHDHDADYAALSHDHTEFLTQAEIEALPGFGGSGGGGAILGEIRLWPLITPPTNWLVCDGSEIGRTSALGVLLGDTYGDGDGSTTYNIPDLRGQVPVGASTSYALATTGGEEEHVLTISEIPPHGGHVTSYVGATYGNNWAGNGSIGGGLGHNNMQPYLALNYIIYGG